LRYRGQAYEMTVECPETEKWDRVFLAAMAARFHAQHGKLYGFADRGRPVEFSVARLAALISREREEPPRVRPSPHPLSKRQWRQARIYFDGRYRPTALYR